MQCDTRGDKVLLCLTPGLCAVLLSVLVHPEGSSRADPLLGASPGLLALAGLSWPTPGTLEGKPCRSLLCPPQFLLRGCWRGPAPRAAAWLRLFRSSLLSFPSVRQLFHLCISLSYNRKFRANYVLIIALLRIYVFRLLHSGIRVSKLRGEMRMCHRKRALPCTHFM